MLYSFLHFRVQNKITEQTAYSRPGINMQNIDLALDMGFTLLSNCFIDNYIKDANDVQLKVYIYLMRCAAAGRATGMNDIVEFFNYPEKDVMRALAYWEKKGIVTLSYHSGRRVSGDEVMGADEEISAISLHTPLPPQKDPSPAVLAEEAAAPAAALSLVKSGRRENGSYSLDDMRHFKQDPGNRFLITAATQYLGRPLSEPEFSSLMYYSYELGFSSELIDYLLQYCISEGKKSFHYISSVARDWADRGIRTPEDARAAVCGMQDAEATTRIMKILGRVGKPAPDETRLIRRWLHTYAFSIDVIEEALKRSVLATEHHRIPYAETILKSWHDKGVRDTAGIEAADAAYHAGNETAKTKAAPAPRTKKSGFTDIEQHDYDFSELEKRILDN